VRVEVGWVCWVEAAVVEIDFPLELADQPIGFGTTPSFGSIG
jgi:hypothetical protein